MKEYKSHAEVDKKYKWDLSFLLENKTPEAALNEIIELWKHSITIKNSKYDSPEAYLKSLAHEEKVAVKFNKFYNYVSNLGSLNVVAPQAKTLEQKFNFEMFKFQSELGSEKTRFFTHAKELVEWAQRPDFKEYKHSINYQLEEKKHLLPSAVEEYKIRISRGTPEFVEVFSNLTDSEIDFGFATSSQGKKIKITRANYQKLTKNNDKEVRKTAYISYRNAYLKHKDSLAALLYQHKKYESATLKAVNHKSTVEGLIFSDRVSTDFLEVLYKSVAKNSKIFKRYMKYYKRFYQNRFGEKMTRYDRNRPLVKVSQNVKVEEAIADVKAALKPFGKEYSQVVETAFNENWVDFMTVKNKRSGAYSIGASYGVRKKLLLMNFTNDVESTSTLAHEMGHSMHSYYSDKVQKTVGNSEYPIFLAEIASIFNELMLGEYFLKTLTNKKTKWFVLDNIITGFIGTVIRQIIFSNFEYDFYNQIDAGAPVGTYAAIAKIYYENNKKYAYEKVRKFDPKDQWISIVVPHFYYGFYVYKYAIGQLVGNIFFAKYKKEGQPALDFYIKNFLSVGGSKNPLDILKAVGVDLTNPQVYDEGFANIELLIDEWAKLGQEIFKPKKN